MQRLCRPTLLKECSEISVCVCVTIYIDIQRSVITIREERKGQERRGQDRTGEDRTGQERRGEERRGEIKQDSDLLYIKI